MTSAAADFVAAVVRPEIRALSAYAVAKAEGMVKLDAMENPHALPADVRARLSEALARVPINRYPDGAADAAKEALRRAFSIPAGQGLLLGNGSDELIQLITSALARPGVIAVAWVIGHLAVTGAIVGARRPGQFREVAAAAAVRLSPRDVDDLDAAQARAAG